MQANRSTPDSLKLILTNLSDDVKEEDLRVLFQRFGNCRISLKIKEITRSASALIIFDDVKNAQTAREELNFTMVLGKEMLIIPFDRNAIKATNSNVFVKNLGAEATNKSLYEMFRPFGEIFSVRLAQDYKGVSKGYGYIQFFSVEDAVKAIEAMNGKELGDKKLLVDLYKVSSRHDRDPHHFTNVFVKNLPSNVRTNEDLENLFADFGDITSVGVFSQEFKGTMGYYGFVNFSNAEDAARAVSTMNDKEIDGVKLFVTRALTKDQREREKIKRKIELRNQSRKFTLHIKSIKGEPLNEELIESELSPYGEIKSITIQKNKGTDGADINTAIGYVVFSRSEDAEQAASDYKKDGPIMVNLLEGKEQRREKLKHMLNMGRIEYGSVPTFMMRGMNTGPKRMPRSAGRGRGRGGPTQRPFQRPMMRPVMPGFNMPGRMPMPMPYSNYMAGAPFAMSGPMGSLPGGIPAGMQPGMGAGGPGGMAMMPGMQPRMAAIPGMGMPVNLPPGAMLNPQMMHQLHPQFMMAPQQLPQNQPIDETIDKDELGEQLYTKIEKMVSPEYYNEVSKITGMLLELQVGEILSLTHDDERLKQRVNEALKLLSDNAEQAQAD